MNSPQLDSDAGRLVRASATVAVGTLLSRLTGLARVFVLAYALGQATLADTYNLANTTPNIVYELFLGGVLTATLVPLFVEHLERRDTHATSAVFTTTTCALVGLTVVAILAAPAIARLYTLDVSGAQRADQIEVMTFLIRCFMPQICFYGIAALATAMLNARRRFVAAAYAPVLNNVVVVCVLLAFTRAATGPQSGWTNVDRIQGDTSLLVLLGIGTTAGVAAMALALLPALYNAGERLKPVFEWRHESVRRMLRLSKWTVGYVVANQVTLLVVLLLAKSGAAGSVSAYQYAFIFFQLPHGLLAVSIMTTITPELARDATAGDGAGLRRDFSLGLRYLIVVVVPAAVAVIALAQPAVAILVRPGGGFSASDAALTADVLQLLAIGLVPFSVYLYTLRGFYARQDTRTPFFINVVENTANIAFALALFGVLGVQGLALAYAAAYLLAAAIALIVLRRQVGDIFGPPLRATVAKAAVAAVALAAVAVPVAGAIGDDTAGRALAAALLAGVAGGAVYLGALTVMRTHEVAALVRLLRDRGTSRPDV